MLQVLTVEGGIAESTDGFQWKLYVVDECIISHTGLSELRYGTWNSRDGCIRSRIRGTAPADLIEVTGARMIEALEACGHQVPFRPADQFECWLLDEQRQPLALLESTIEKPPQDSTSMPQWSPGAAAKRDFESSHGDVGRLAEMLQRQAGSPSRALWIQRTPNGSGLVDDNYCYGPDAFPELFIRTQWPEPGQAALVADFLSWQAPWLLQLHHLDLSTRARLEQAAWQRPTETSRVFRLFPLILDQHSLTTVRVKSRFMTEQETPVQAEPFYPFYNE